MAEEAGRYEDEESLDPKEWTAVEQLPAKSPRAKAPRFRANCSQEVSCIGASIV
jgi:hypothetical protein